MSDRSSPGVTRISPQPGGRVDDVRELLASRELLWVLASRDVRVRYKQTVFGALWALLQPLALMAVFSVFLGRLARVPHDGASYPLFVLTALTVWTYVSTATDAVANSVVSNAHMVSKVYFPRLALPFAAAGGFLLDLVFAASLLVVAVAVFGDGLTLAALATPLFLVISILVVLGVGTWLAALNVRYRDVRFVLRFGLQLWLFLSPVVYSSSLVPERWQWAYQLNPLVGPIDGLRWAVLGVEQFPSQALLVSLGVTFTLLVSGTQYFQRTEHLFADVV